MSEVSYTYDWYRRFLGRLETIDGGYHGFDSWQGEPGVLLRHDVDYSPEAARRMARIEADAGVRGTYFVLTTSPFYNVLDPAVSSLLHDVADLGHEIGLHFDSHAYFGDEPGTTELRQRIEEDKEIMQTVFPDITDTIAFHNPPDWSLNQSFPGTHHTYEPRFFDDISYYADSLGRWRDKPPLQEQGSEPVQVLLHPGLWGEEAADPKSRVRDAEREMVKRADEWIETESDLDWNRSLLKSG